MKDIAWAHPKDNEKGVLENPGQGKSFNDPLIKGDLVKLRSGANYVQVRITDITNPEGIVGQVALSNEAEALNSLHLETEDTVKFRKNQIFVRVFGE